MPQHVPSPLRAALTRPAQYVPALPPQPRRIVFLARRDLGNPAAGGSELLVDRLAEGLTELGHQVTLLCGGPAAYRDYRVVSAGGDLGHYLRARPAFHRQVGDCDLLVEVCNGMPYLAPLWHHGPTLCLVNHVHTDLWKMRFGGPLAPAARLGRRLEHWALAGAQRHNLLVAVSPSTAHALRAIGVERDRIRVVHNGVEEPGPKAARSPEPLFVAMGRLVEYKRIDLLLRLWERVRPVTGGRLVIVGDGPERGRLEQLAGPGVEFAGHVSEAEKHRLLCAAWLLLHPPPSRAGVWSSPRRPHARPRPSPSTYPGCVIPWWTAKRGCWPAASPRSRRPGAPSPCPPTAAPTWARPPATARPGTAGTTRSASSERWPRRR